MMNENKQRILAVDDDPDIIEYVRAVMEDAGYEVSSATNSAECLQKLEEFAPDLVILDIQMPGEPGFYTLRKIKENLKTCDVPVIILSGASERLGITFGTQDMYDFLGRQPDAYLEKPVDPATLLKTVEGLLRTSRPKRQPDA